MKSSIIEAHVVDDGVAVDGKQLFDSLANLHAHLLMFGMAVNENYNQAKKVGEIPVIDLSNSTMKTLIGELFKAANANKDEVRRHLMAGRTALASHDMSVAGHA